MKLNRKALIALAVGWFVLVDILLRTTEGSVSALNSIALSFRGIIRGLGGSSYSSYYYLLVNLGIIGLVLLVALTFLILIFLSRAWRYVIRLSRYLVNYLFFTNSEGEQKDAKEMVYALFGENAMSAKDSLFWLTLRSLLTIWSIIILVTIIAGLINALSTY